MISPSFSGRDGDFREVEAEPLGERGVEIVDIAVGVGGEETGRRAVQISDRRLQLGEARLFPHPLHGDLIDLPHDQRAVAARPRIGRHGLDRDAKPARAKVCLLLFAFARRGQAELLLQAAALLSRAREPKDRLGEMRVAGKGAVRRGHAARFGIEAEQIAIGLVGVKHAPRAIGDQGPVRQIVDKGPGDIVARLARAEMENADGAGKQTKHTDHSKTGKDGEDEGLGHFARHHGEDDRGDRQGKGEDDDETHIAVTFGSVGGGRGVAHRRVDIGHERQNSRFE